MTKEGDSSAITEKEPMSSLVNEDTLTTYEAAPVRHGTTKVVDKH